MLGTMLKDKERIEQTIKELDRYNHDATWEKVNGKRYFSKAKIHKLSD